MDNGCQNIPPEMFNYCHNVLLCQKTQCMVSSAATALVSAAVLLASAFVTILHVLHG